MNEELFGTADSSEEVKQYARAAIEYLKPKVAILKHSDRNIKNKKHRAKCWRCKRVDRQMAEERERDRMWKQMANRGRMFLQFRMPKRGLSGYPIALNLTNCFPATREES